jgi:hypothetical protein
VAAAATLIFAGIATLAVGTFLAIRREGETFGQTFFRVLGDVKTFAINAWQNGFLPFIQGFKQGFMPIFTAIKPAIASITDSFRFLFESMFGGLEMGHMNWAEIGALIGGFVARSIEAVANVMALFVLVGASLAHMFMTVLSPVISMVVSSVQHLGAAFGMIAGGEVLKGLVLLGATLLDNVLTPIRLIIQGMIKMADLAGAGALVPADLRTFATEGFAGLLLGNEAEAKAGAQAPPKVEANIKLEDKRCVEVEVKANLDGKDLSNSVARVHKDIQERSGFKAQPWQRKMAAAHGVIPGAV